MVILELMNQKIFFLVTVVMRHAELLYSEGKEIQLY